ncbi:NAD-dependent epimerase/dehydratase family protein [Streptomyces sp. LP11]|uniref:NAD-dependent epimerase/dehydratase family protein n=1 Tax=Streptomyces pyxinicus TaxID=2970331 RepID=A0ABT2AX15_9ACTN|nr:NAD-dependent epimerase/dehydratase family protein [Streptomyces sp. LP11]MCS0600779.1 NAD-dependent epimerase/dehydratase family protein [Streptomyces sp. LP11]
MVIGATGQIGRPAVAALARDGWQVTAASQSGGRAEEWPGEVRAVRLDRADGAALAEVVGEGCDVLVDIVAYDASHARQLTSLADRIGSAVVVSSVSVYEDARGCGFDTQDRPDGFPVYPVPLPETQRTVAPGERTYSTRKAALERELLAAGERLPATLLRAGAVHGPHSRVPRELYFVKRNLDRRGRRVLAYGGASRFHPASAHNLAELIRLAAARPGSRVLNACDAEAPTVAGIGAAIDAVMGAENETVLVDGPPPAPGVGDSPWAVPHSVVADMTAAERELGYRPVVGYAESLPETVAGIERRLAGRDWRAAYPKVAQAYGDLFDYAAEDAWPGA